MKKQVNAKIIKKIILIVLIAFVIYQVCYTVYTMLNPKTPCKFLWFNVYEVNYSTMEPMLKKGDIVVTCKPKEENLQKGTIVAFQKGENFLVHRIQNVKYKKTGKLYETKGDSNTYPDNELLKITDIQGQYIFKITKMRLIAIIILLYIMTRINLKKIFIKNRKKRFAKKAT